MATKNEIFNRYVNEYIKAKRIRKKEILNTICELMNIHRKTAVRKFHRLQFDVGDAKKKRGRKAWYTTDVVIALKTIWLVLGEVCGELIHPMINEIISVLKQRGEWHHSINSTEKLHMMSLATTKRIVGKFFKIRNRRRGISATKPNHIKSIIPIFTGPWEMKPPGYGQIDTVVHCGSTLCGDMVYSVNFTDVATGWVVLAAQWNKGQESTRNSLERMRDKTPFPIIGMHPDTGSEFVNYHLKDWCDREKIELTRSRPNHKNDNAYVEQKNGHVIRRFLGYERFDKKELIPVINNFYDELETYINHFIPTRKCIAKIRIGARYRRKYDTAMTPYRRVLASQVIPSDYKNLLQKKHDKLNPLRMKTKIDTLIDKIIKTQQIGNTN